MSDIDRWGVFAPGSKGGLKPGPVTEETLAAAGVEAPKGEKIPSEAAVPQSIRRQAAAEELPDDVPASRKDSAAAALSELMADSPLAEKLAADLKDAKPLEYSNTPEPEKPVPAPAPEAAMDKTVCGHCGRARGLATVEPSDDDKINFLQAILGEQRFIKVYPLFNGRAQVAFRTLYAEESDLCYTQVALDANQGDVVDAPHYFRTLNDYRLCLGLHVLEMGAKRINLPLHIDSYPRDEKIPPGKRSTRLKQIVPWVYRSVLHQESLRRAVANAYYDFQTLVEKLEMRADDPNFWPATGGQS